MSAPINLPSISQIPDPATRATINSLLSAINLILGVGLGPGPPSFATFVDWETPSGTIDGANTTFTLAQAPNPAASAVGYVRQGGGGAFLPMAYGVDFTLSGVTITATEAPSTSSDLRFSYRY